jgi:hypothetical protein
LGDVPPELVVPRSLADDRVRQFDELDRPRFTERRTNRGAQLNDERITVVATTGEADAQLALEQFSLAWNEFSRLADSFTITHRNPDFAIGQLLVVIDSEYREQRPDRSRRCNGRTGKRLFTSTFPKTSLHWKNSSANSIRAPCRRSWRSRNSIANFPFGHSKGWPNTSR